jgi:tetratricopeptide (TPR) repeat protein
MARSTYLFFFLFGFLILMIHPSANACINDFENNRMRDSRFGALKPTQYISNLKAGFEPVEKSELAAKKSAADSGSFEKKSDYAVALIKLGRSKEAIAILEPLAAEHPTEYIIAANLGTAYELVGENAKALEWIQKGVKLNPESHEGTEWLHVKILEAKIAHEKDPNWFKKNSILGLDFGKDATPKIDEISITVMENKGDEKPLTATQKALEYQLHERLGFVKQRDAVVADLLFTLGNILMVKDTPQHAELVYGLASEFTVDPLDNQVLIRQAESQKLAQSARFKQRVMHIVQHPLAIIAVIVVAGYVLMKLVMRLYRRIVLTMAT